MTTIARSVSDIYDEYMASGDPLVTTWPFMGGPAPTIIMVVTYVLLVKVIGPIWMLDKKPYDFRYPMFLYNLGLVLTNVYLILEAFRVLLKGNRNVICREENRSDPDAIRMAELGWWFFIMKFVEFADTIFFVLRKKYNHISTLHIVHHATVPLAVWAGLRIEPGSYNYFFPLLNSLVHTVMYTYYGLAALGPNIQKYLWWKKYLTTLQITQFVVVFLYILILMASNCKVSKFIIYLNMFLAGLFLLMFLDYFQNTYLRKSKLKVVEAKVVQNGTNGVVKKNIPFSDCNQNPEKKIS